MNKDEMKMIEEMAKVIDDNLFDYCDADGCINNRQLAKTLVNAGYRKVAEDEIIINTEEHTKILDRILKTGRREGYTLGREYVEGRDKLVAKDFAKSIIFATEGDDSDETMKIEDFHNTIREILKRVYNEEIGW